MVVHVTVTPCFNVTTYLGVKQMNVTLHEDTEPRRQTARDGEIRREIARHCQVLQRFYRDLTNLGFIKL